MASKKAVKKVAKKVQKSAGQVERTHTITAQARRELNYLSHRLDPLNTDAITYRVRMFRRTRRMGTPYVYDFDGVTTDLEWLDTIEDPILRGQITVVRPPNDEAPFSLDAGDQIRLDMHRSGRWQEVWTMRVRSPTITLQDQTYVAELVDDLSILAQSTDSIRWAKGKRKRRKGWRAHEIARDVAGRYHFKLGTLVKGTHWITNLDEKAKSPFTMIRDAYNEELQHTGRETVFRWRNGRLNVVPPKQSDMFIFGSQIRDPEFTRTRAAGFCTAIKARTTVGKKKKRKLVRIITSDALVQRHGFIIIEATPPAAVDTTRELVNWGKRELARRSLRTPQLKFTHPGISWLEPGNLMRVNLPAVGIRGNVRVSKLTYGDVAYVKSIQHTMTAGDYSMEVECSFDPIKGSARADALLKDEVARKKKAVKRKKKKKTGAKK